MHFVYFAEQKLERFYDFLVERTEMATTKRTVSNLEMGAGVKGKGEIGKLLAMLGLAKIAIEAEVSATGKLSFDREVVSRFTPPQKLKALLLKLSSENRLVELTVDGDLHSLPEEGAVVLFSTRLKTDYDRRSDIDVERKGAAVLTGKLGDFRAEVQASLRYMESENAWRRWEQPRRMVAFATLIGVNENDRLLEFDPIVIGYAQPS
jgi:hypothetical protein